MECQLHSSVYQIAIEVFLLTLQNIKLIIERALTYVCFKQTVVAHYDLFLAVGCNLKEIYIVVGFVLLHDITVDDLSLSHREPKRQNL